MVTNGVSVYDVAQVFGDRGINSTNVTKSALLLRLTICSPSPGNMNCGGRFLVVGIHTSFRLRMAER